MRVEAQQSTQPRPKATRSGRSPDDSNDLTERRQKKREIDGLSAQNNREKGKSRIAYLEGLVENLTSQDGSFQSLADQLSEAVKERDRLSGTLTDIRRLLASLEPKRGPESVRKTPSLDPGNASTEDCPIGTRNAAGLPPSFDNSISLSTEAETTVQINNSDDLRPARVTDVDTQLCSGDHVSHADYTQHGPCECNVTSSVSQAGPGASLWRYTDYVLSEHFRSQEMIVDSEDAMRQDTFVRALVHGWNSIGPITSLPLSWRILRRIDEHYFSMCSHVERLAVMIALYPLLQYHREPTLERRSKVCQL